MNASIAQHIIFTGAGFTKNFGGFLAMEMWTQIFNHPEVQKQPRLRELLLNDFDYESIYYQVLAVSNDAFESVEKKAIHEAVRGAYGSIDEIISKCGLGPYGPQSANIGKVNDLLKCCAGNNTGFFFTINQDLFIERYCDIPHKKAIYPFFKENWILCPGKGEALPDDQWVTLPGKDEIDTKKAKSFASKYLYYLKLHGSYGWKSSDGTEKMVIGRNKEQQITHEPLLKRYFELFQNVLSQGKSKLLVIGYGFRDEHINRVIAESINTHGLEVYVLSPMDPKIFINDLEKGSITDGKLILAGIKGYFPYTLTDVVPPDGKETYAWRELNKCYFGK